MALLTTILDQPETPILIVDDSREYGKVLERMLRNGLGFENITRKESTEDAFGVITENPDTFKILFVDFHFPVG